MNDSCVFFTSKICEILFPIKIKLKNIKSSWNNVIPRTKIQHYLEKILNIVFIISLFSLNMYINFKKIYS